MSNRVVAYALHYGSAERPLATVVPDEQWPGMWRIAWPDGHLSDMVNLSRAKDAAEVLCATGPKSALLHWKRHGCDKPSEARTGDWIDWPPDGGAPAVRLVEAEHVPPAPPRRVAADSALRGRIAHCFENPSARSPSRSFIDDSGVLSAPRPTEDKPTFDKCCAAMFMAATWEGANRP